ncbi:hypothetical protein LY76DRAFT_259008 [Colletotrichum caudatum]|nr:hypothetical protein LY76DRAFT_259008 [Colletotrichum caudatum]
MGPIAHGIFLRTFFYWFPLCRAMVGCLGEMSWLGGLKVVGWGLSQHTRRKGVIQLDSTCSNCGLFSFFFFFFVFFFFFLSLLFPFSVNPFPLLPQSARE